MVPYERSKPPTDKDVCVMLVVRRCLLLLLLLVMMLREEEALDAFVLFVGVPTTYFM